MLRVNWAQSCGAQHLTRQLTMVLLASVLAGCAATETMLAKKDLDVQAKTSTAVFVQAVPKEKRTIFLDIKSGVMEFDRRQFKDFVKEQFTLNNDNGYVIVDDPDAAQFHMVAYVLNLEKTSPTAAEQSLNKGFVGASASAGAVAGALANDRDRYTGAASGGLIGGAAEFVTGSLVKDVFYMLVCDVQITEKARDGVMVRKDSSVNMKISDAGSSKQTVSEVSNTKEYRTRIVTTANQVNLKLQDAEKQMFQKTAYAMAGFF